MTLNNVQDASSEFSPRWKIEMRQLGLLTLVGLAGCLQAALTPAKVYAQVCGPIYQVRPQVVYERQQVQRYRLRTVYEDQEVVTQRPVLKTRMEKQTYTVSTPVVETSTVEEKYTVWKPVTKTEWIDRSYDETTYVTETAEREENYTTYRPVTETTYQTRSYVVQRPVTETQYRTQNYTTMRPVTTYQNAVVDQGQYMTQQYYQPGDTRYHLRWQSGGYLTDPYGNSAYRRGGLGWVPYTSAGSTYNELVYQPNPVQVSVPRTQMVPEVQQQQVPVQVTRMESQRVDEQVPVTTTRMEAVQQTRRVPYSVQKPVTRRIENKVPVTRTEYVRQEMVRPKTVKRTTYKLETREREVPVQYYETQSVTTTVKVARRVWEPYIVERLVPRTVQTPVVLSYYDPYSVPTSRGMRPWVPSAITSAAGAQEEVRRRPEVPEIDSDPEASESETDSGSEGGLELSPSA